MLRWRLYGTLGCHLCEQAIAVLAQLQKDFLIELSCIDIADDEQLVAAMGDKIPVLENGMTGEQMAWPFDPEKLTDWLEAAL